MRDAFPNGNGRRESDQRETDVKYLHTMVRVTDLEASLDFYCNKLGLEEIRRIDVEAARFSLIFLAGHRSVAGRNPSKAG